MLLVNNVTQSLVVSVTVNRPRLHRPPHPNALNGVGGAYAPVPCEQMRAWMAYCLLRPKTEAKGGHNV